MRFLLPSVSLLSAFALFAPSVAAMGASEYASTTLDASVLVEATPDVINVSLTCSFNEPLSRSDVRRHIASTQKSLETDLGSYGKVRKQGTPSVYDHYDINGSIDGTYTGSVNFLIQNIAPENTAAIEKKLDEIAGCTSSWDARVFRFGALLRTHKEELMSQINEKKEIFEDLLGIKLDRVSGISAYGAVDTGGTYSYYGNTYDPMTNTIVFLLTMSITYDFGTGEKE